MTLPENPANAAAYQPLPDLTETRLILASTRKHVKMLRANR